MLALRCGSSIQAQVGFNNPNPHPKSILDLTAPDKGLLIPRMGQALREALFPAPDPTGEGMLVYQTDNARGLYYYDGNSWFLLNEWVRQAGSNDAAIGGNASIGGTVSASNYALNSNGNGPVPAGGIIMWSGSPTAIPTGWALCDGTNGTPDLRERFIVGAGGDNPTVVANDGMGGPYNLSDVGGSNGVALTEQQLAFHSHFPGTLFAASSGAHTHRFRSAGNRGPGGAGREPYGWTEITGGSTHVTSNEGAHTHSILGSTAPTGNGAYHENRPPYYALAFIMKLP